MKAFLIGLLIGIIFIPVATYFYFRQGRAPAAAADPPLPFERRLATMALHAHIDKEAPSQVPMQANDANFQAGAKVYRQNCAVCHGLIGQLETSIAKGEYPAPPQLLEKDGMVTDDTPGETYWKVANGIRLTGMPAFKKSVSEDGMWQVSLMLANADKLPADVQAILKAPFPEDPAPAAGATPGTAAPR